MTAPSSDPNADMGRVLAALREARLRLEAAERRDAEPIAIVGLGCRFPGAPDVESFWELLNAGRDAIGEPSAARRAKTHSGAAGFRPGGYLPEVEGFDPEFFNISPREAESLDPQQRLLLEVAHEALEHAGCAPAPGDFTGVFVGIGQNDYAHLALYGRPAAQIGPYDGTGNGFCFASGRLSYWLGLRGPNLAVDTACSSSLTAIHLAVQSLRLGECDTALAGGVQLALAPAVDLFLERTGALAPDGRCKAFDAAANGFGRGEGCGMVVLKRLSDALAEGYQALAVIRSSAVNHDGHSSGLTVPNPKSQAALIRRALARGRLRPEDIHYVETHGTGTALGDPLEAEALGEVFAGPRPRPLPLGSVKANIGHLEAAAGIAGLIKTVLLLRHRRIPPQPRFGRPNPRILWSELPLVVADRAMLLEEKGPLRAGISSFGMAGSNAHVILEEAPAALPAALPAGGPRLFVLSARDPRALEDLRERYRTYLTEHPGLDVDAVCLTAGLGRRHLEERLALLAASTADIASALTEGRFMRGRAAPETLPSSLGTGHSSSPDRAALPPSPEELARFAELYVRGVEPRWSELWPRGHAPRVVLPTYPFQRRRFWIEAPPPATLIASPVAELLGQGDAAGLCALIEPHLDARVGPHARAVIEALLQRHLDARPDAARSDCYAVEWRPVDGPRPASWAAPGVWLILGQDGGIGERLAVELRGRGQRVVLAAPGARLERRGDDAFAVMPERAEDFVELLEFIRQDGRPLRGVVHLWGPDHPEPTTAADLEASQRQLCGGALQLLRAQLRVVPAPFWTVTQGASQVAGERPAPFQAPLWGLGRTVWLERPDLRGGLVDLDPAQLAPGDIATLADLLLAPAGESQIALRGGVAHAPRLRAVPKVPSAPLPVRADAAYLITGGLGGLGLEIARWLAARGARHLLLNGRRAPDPDTQRVLAALAGAGTRIDLIQADVADEAGLRAALDGLPVRGVIHAAGVQGRQSLETLEVADLMATLRPKVLGGWVLHGLGLDLDFFVSLSSIAGVWGSRDQAHYAAANHFLETLAQYRRSRGEAGVSLAFGPWAGVGMASDADRAALAGMGIAALDRAATLELLGPLAAADHAETVVARVDWQRFLPFVEQRGPLPLFDELRAAGSAEPEAATPPGGDFVAVLLALPPEQRRAALLDHLRRQVADILGFADPQAIDPDRGFFAMGMDSMMSVQLAERLRSQLGKPLPATLAFEFPNLSHLAAHLGGELLNEPPAAAPVSLAAAPDTTAPNSAADIAERLARLENLMRI
jgi:acyl transferase domain-containing protein/acyl carrier protein